MPKPINKDCLECCKRITSWAIAAHGPDTISNCWAGQTCHNRRSYYRRYLRNLTIADEGNLSIDKLPSSLYAILIQWKMSGGEVHAMGGEVWKGQKLLNRVEPFHCMGMTASELFDCAQKILLKFNEQQLGKSLHQFKSSIVLPAQQCRISECPLHS